eukprot:TRINITY_DN40893_c0_g1_i1.p2 TRINITY_DN40893_c0_g1~~TRINITY_DN40893_c0_g1_i1.p2  ORF type:complete len:137 (-),score=26.31 TRINITY_DN40893_c0_g1_i1:839-1249(-)
MDTLGLVKHRGWPLREVVELAPSRAGASSNRKALLGLNDMEGGVHIAVKVSDTCDSLAPSMDILATFLHELAHFNHGPHDINFYKFFGELVADFCAIEAMPGSFEQELRRNIIVRDGLSSTYKVFRAFQVSYKRAP